MEASLSVRSFKLVLTEASVTAAVTGRGVAYVSVRAEGRVEAQSLPAMTAAKVWAGIVADDGHRA